MGGVTRRPELAGRARERTQLQAALQEVLNGSGRLILIAGEPGIGKTRTAEELAREARERGANVAWGRCWGEAGAPDLWPWMQVIRTCLRAVDEDTLRQLVGPHGSELTALVALTGSDAPATVSPASRFRLFNAIAHFLDAYSLRVPLVIILEDLHRADPSSLLLLQFFTQEQRQRRILLIGTYREPNAPPNRALTQAVIEAMRESGSERITLGSLSENESESMLRSLLDEEVPPELLRTLHWRTGGNPLFLAECARLLPDRDERGTRLWKSAADLPIPAELREVLEQRLEPLSGEHRAVLVRAAVCDGHFHARDLVTATDPTGDEQNQVKAALAEAETLGLLRSGGTPGSFRFAQEMMREWLSGEAPATLTPPPSPVDTTVALEGKAVRPPAPTIFRREGEYWTIAFRGQTSRIKDAKGLAYVSFLLRQPHVEVHVSELVNLGAGPADPVDDRTGIELGTLRFGLGDSGVVLDAQAKAAYRTRLEELRGELFEAETFHDTGRAERTRAEIDFLTQELVSATGLGGRDRRVGSDTERARVNITRAIVRALARIDESDPELGRHLRRTIKTGIFCMYTPDASVETNWEL